MRRRDTPRGTPAFGFNHQEGSDDRLVANLAVADVIMDIEISVDRAGVPKHELRMRQIVTKTRELFEREGYVS